MSLNVTKTIMTMATAVALLGVPAFAENALQSGTFSGQQGHAVSGTATIIEDGGKYFVELGDDFSLDGAPDPSVALGNDGVDPSTKTQNLTSLTGRQRFALPDGVDPAGYNEIYIYCAEFSVTLGVAKLQ